jgi:nitric oxide reductase subunit B
VHSHFMETLVWLRVPGDIVFALGTLFLVWFALRLLTGGKRNQAVHLPVANAKRA